MIPPSYQSDRCGLRGGPVGVPPAVDSYCYDNADRLSTHVPVSGTSPFNGVSYDSHGNVIKMGSEVHGYDSADRHIISKLPGGAVEYVRDATDRIVTRKLSGVISAKYAYTASADSPSLTLNSPGWPLSVRGFGLGTAGLSVSP